MGSSVLVRWIVLGASYFAAGVAFYMAAIHLHAGLWHRKLWDIWSALVEIGIAAVVMLIAEAVYHAPGVPYTWRAAVYTTGLGFIAVGFVGLAVSKGKHNKRWTDRREGG